MEQNLDGVTLLGNQNTKYQFDYDPSILERFESACTNKDMIVSLDCFEFCSRCPKTGQPDFATIHISYIPDKYMVESKSLKLYLFSFQQHGDFHEKCIDMIANDLYELLDPKYIEVFGDFNSRGGISILPLTIICKPEYEDYKKHRQLDTMNKMMSHTKR